MAGHTSGGRVVVPIGIGIVPTLKISTFVEIFLFTVVCMVVPTTTIFALVAEIFYLHKYRLNLIPMIMH